MSAATSLASSVSLPVAAIKPVTRPVPSVYKCNKCKFTDPVKGNVSKHKQAAHPHLSTRFSCDQCDFTNSQRAGIEAHKRSKHSNEKPFACTECNFKSPHSYTLTAHIKRVHGDEKPYRCDQCDFVSAYSQSVVNHKVHIISKCIFVVDWFLCSRMWHALSRTAPPHI
jgi:KRAB domain-containing zinc finger protein